MYAAPVADPMRKCSFCGKSADSAAQLFGPESEAVARAAICDECVLTCAKAIDVEQRLSERPQAKARGDAAPDSERPREGGWSPFEFGNLMLEWRAEPAMIVSVRRSDNHERVVVEQFGRDTEPTIDDAETVAEDHWAKLHG